MKKIGLFASLISSVAAMAAPMNDLALNQRVSVSSNEASVTNCIDGVRDEKSWQVALSETPWLCVDLGQEQNVGCVVLVWTADAHATDYTVAVSKDGQNYKTVVTAQNGKGYVDGFGFSTESVRYVKLTLQKGVKDIASLRAFEVYEGRDKTNVVQETPPSKAIKGELVREWKFEDDTDWREAKFRDIYPLGFINNYTWGKKDIEVRPCQGYTGTGLLIDIRGISQGEMQFWTAPWSFWRNKYYKITFKARAENFEGFFGYQVRRAILDWTTLVGGNLNQRLTEDWQEFTYSGMGHTDVDNDFGAMFSAGNIGKIYLDDIRVEVYDENPSTAKLVKNENPVVQGNLIPNASLEIERNKFWTTCQTSGDPSINLLDPQFTRHEGGKFGKYCYAFPCTVTPRGYSANVGVVSIRIPVASGVPYTFSFWYNGKGKSWSSVTLQTKKVNGEMARGSGWFAPPKEGWTDEWHRFTVTTTPIPEHCDSLDIEILKQGEGEVYIDGMQLEVGDQATDFKPMHPYEIQAVVTGGMPNIIDWGQKIPLELTAYSALEATASAKIPATLKVIAYPGKVVLEKKVVVETDKIEKLEIDPVENGIFFITLTPDDPQMAPVFENIAGRLPKPRADVGEESFFGAHIMPRPYFLNYSHRIGIKWERLHDCSSIAKMGQGNPEPGVYRWYDDEVDAIKKAGFYILGMPDYFPKWAYREPDAKRDGFTKNNADKGENPINVVAFSNWCYQVSQHYRGKIDAWELVNEPYMNYFYPGNARHYAELYEAGLKAVRAANPKAKVVGWCTEFTSNGFIADMPKEKISDIDAYSFHAYFPTLLGGGTMSLKKDLADLKEKALTVRDPGQYWNTEGSCGSLARWYAFAETLNKPQNHITAATYMSRTWIEQKKAGINKFFFYGILQCDSLRYNGGFKYLLDFDRSLTTSAAATAVTAWFIDGLDPKPFTQLEGVVESLFSGKGRTSYVVYDDPLYSGNYTLDITKIPSDYLVCDVMGTDLRKAGIQQIKVESTPLFILAESTDFAKVFDACQAALIK